MNLEEYQSTKISDVMNKDVLCAGEGASVESVVKLMTELNVGAIVIINMEKKPIGIFTERDLLNRVVAKSKDPATTTIDEVMTKEPKILPSETTIGEVIDYSQKMRVRHMIFADNDKLTGIISIRDISGYLIKSLDQAYKELENSTVQLMQAAKLTAIGEIGAGVAHEMNQPLMAISTHMESLLMSETVTGNPALSEKLKKIKDQFVRLGTIVRRVHEYSGIRKQGFVEEDVNRPVRDGVYLLSQQLKDHNIAVSMELEEDHKTIHLDRYQIQDVVVNFLVNARDAVDERFNQQEGGEIKIISKTLRDGKGVLCGVIENGVPVKEGTEKNIFNAFFTTKSPGKGTGLGLSVCSTIVKNHNGVTGFAALPNGRKIFYFVLPFDKDKALHSDAEFARNLAKEWESL